ncbi:MAG: hypothetical protein JXB17_00985 [Bacteroidales bacterium]|nr:hypothetical protein [Bacteroidales bacterium]
MRIEQSEKYVLTLEQANNVINKLKEMNSQCLMDNKLMVRTLFIAPVENRNNWIRVRLGDVNINKEDICAITFKTMIEHAGSSRESVIDLEVKDYDQAVELLDRIGLERKSKQESKRTKYICTYDNGRYSISIDEWPWLDSVRLVNVHPVSGAEQWELEEFIQALKLDKCESYSGGIDQVYEKKCSFKLTNVDDVRFGITPPAANK